MHFAWSIAVFAIHTIIIIPLWNDNIIYNYCSYILCMMDPIIIVKNINFSDT